jgi:EAL domain-containing protein (putative c-di-GMP-specific phosphodiesterase class I)
LIENYDHAIATINQFVERGITISLDDFGTGYSSLSYLSKYPVSTLKIDSSLVTGLLKNHKNRVITQTLIELSHSLGLKIVAEGVETLAEYEYFKNSDCDEIQGFYFSRPLSFKDYQKQFLLP